MPDATHGINVPLTKLEIAASLGAVGAVMDSCPGTPPEPLVSAFEKFDHALATLNQQPADATETEEPVGEECDYCGGDGGYRVTSGRMVDGKPVEKTNWVTCERCYGSGKSQPESPSSSTELRNGTCSECGRLIAPDQHLPGCPFYDFSEQDAMVRAAEGNKWLENAGVVAWSEFLLALRQEGYELSATTPPDGGLEEHLFSDEAIEAAARKAFRSDHDHLGRPKNADVPLGKDETDVIRSVVRAAWDAATDQSPETNPSPSQGEGGGVR